MLDERIDSVNMLDSAACERKLLIAALRTIAEDVNNEVLRIGRGGRVDLETMYAWKKLADQALDGCE